MRDERKTAPRLRLRTSAAIQVGAGLGIGFAITSIPNWPFVWGGVAFGVLFGLTAVVVQYYSPTQTAELVKKTKT
jgi:hypothetical protein